jgi:two-component system capsular synthesis response regulator RcsB
MVISGKINQLQPKSLSGIPHVGEVLIRESCVMIQAGIRSILAQYAFHDECCLGVSTIHDMPLMMATHKVALIIMELNGKGESVFDSLRMIDYLRRGWPSIPLIVCTALTDPRILKQLLALEVNNIYFKQDLLSTFSLHILRAFCPSMKNEMGISPHSISLLRDDDVLLVLSKREITVLECLLAGNSVTRVAQLLKRDVRTVSSQKRSAMLKLGLRNDYALYSWGSELALQGRFWAKDSGYE